MLLFSGKIISQLLDQIYAFALCWYIIDLTKSSLQMAVFLMLNNIVYALIAPFGGIIADRLSRKNIMVWMDIIRGITVLVAAFLLYHQLLQIWMLYISAVILSFCGAIFSPAAGAIIPNIVDENQLTQAQSSDQFIYNFCMMIGMLIGGILYNFLGVFMVFIFNAISYFISGFMEFCVNIPVRQRKVSIQKNTLFQEIQKTINELKDGFQYFYGNKVVFKLLLMNAAFNFLALSIVMVFTPYFYNVILKATSFQLAITQAGAWIGIILGTFLIAVFFYKYKLRKSIFLGLLICALTMFIEVPIFIPQIRLHFTNWEITTFLTITKVIGGFAIIFFTIPMYVAFQKYTADHYRGRFWGLETSIHTFALSSGYFIAGFLAQRVWLGYLQIIIGSLILAINLWIINVKEIIELKN